MPASTTRTFRISHVLAEALDILAKELGYDSTGALLKGLIRFAIATKARHVVTLAWSRLSLRDQDKLEEKLLARLKAGLGMTSEELKHSDWRDWEI